MLKRGLTFVGRTEPRNDRNTGEVIAFSEAYHPARKTDLTASVVYRVKTLPLEGRESGPTPDTGLIWGKSQCYLEGV